MKKTLTFQQKFVAIKPNYKFCLPTCNALTYKSDNVAFYDTTQEAIQNGFRPCESCKPMELEGETSKYIQEIIKDLNHNPFFRIKDYDLKERGIEPNQIREWFKKNHNITFHTYQRMLRINTAFQSITVDKASENNRSIFGELRPSQENQTIINIVRFTTPLGPLFSCATLQGLCLLDFTDRKMLETEFKDLCTRLNAIILPGDNPHLDQVQSELTEYFSGKRKKFTIPLHTPGTEFQQSVWNILQDIPYGTTRSYKQQAIDLNNPKAVRAVASANGHNRVSIIIPCHRVIGADGKLVGYGGGLDRKQWLLEFESGNSG